MTKNKKNNSVRGAAGLSPGNQIVVRDSQTAKQREAKKKMSSQFQVGTRYSPFLAMLLDPVSAKPALPPVALPFRASALPFYHEYLMSTDANGAASVTFWPNLALHFSAANVVTGTTVAWTGGTQHSQYTSFAANFNYYVPLVMEVVVKYTGSMTATSGRLYGIVSSGGLLNAAMYPQEPTGCEAVTAEGISCKWVGTSGHWNNSIATSTAVMPPEYGDSNIQVALIGGPPSVSNVASVGVYLHVAATPKSSIVGLQSGVSMPDPTAVIAAGLLAADENGVGKSVVPLTERERHRKQYTGRVRDALKMGGKVVGTLTPAIGAALDAAEALSLLML